jgi:hypothetical protein
MKQNYKFITYSESKQLEHLTYLKKTKIIKVNNRKTGNILGWIKWYSPWRQYCFFPYGDTVYSMGCLIDITSFVAELLKESNDVSDE